MKRMMKRGLSLLLAVLMVASMLPTSVWAVTFADSEDSTDQEERPVVDQTDPVVRPYGSGSGLSYDDLYGDHDPDASTSPEEPDPSEGPGPGAELNEAVFAGVSAGNNSGSGPILSAVVEGADHLTFLIVPNFKMDAGDDTSAQIYDGYLSSGEIYEQAGAKNPSNVTDPSVGIMGSTTFPYAYYSTAQTADGYPWHSVSVDWNGNLTGNKGSNTSYTETLTALSSFDNIKPSALNDWLNGLPNGTTLYDNAGSSIWSKGADGTVTTSLSTLPFRIYAIASGKSAATNFNIPFAGEPLTLLIEPRTMTTGITTITFAEVQLRNNTDADIVVTQIDLNRGARQNVTTAPAGYGTTTVTTDSSTGTNSGRIGISKTNAAPSGTTNVRTVSGTWTVPAYSTITAAYLNHVTVNALQAQGYYNLTATATYASGTASGNGGLRIKNSANSYTVNLVDSGGTRISETGHSVNIVPLGVDLTDKNDSKTPPLTEGAAGQFTGSSTVSGYIYVDGHNTGLSIDADNNTVNVPMYKLTKTITGNTPPDPTWTTTIGGVAHNFDYIPSVPGGLTAEVTAPAPGTFTFSWGPGSYLTDANADTANRKGNVSMTTDWEVIADYAGETWSTTVITQYPAITGALSQGAVGTNTFMIVDSTDLNTAVGTVVNNNGKYTITKLPPDKTYYIKINGQLVYDTNRTDDLTGADPRTPVAITNGGTTTVDMGQINMVKDPATSASTLAMDNGGEKSGVYYFPSHSYLDVTVTESGDKLLKLEHDADGFGSAGAAATDITTPKAFHVTATRQEVKATFGYEGQITLWLNGVRRTRAVKADDVKSVQLYPDNGSGAADTTATPVTAVRQGAAAAAGLPVTANYKSDSALKGTYHVYVNGFPTGVTVSDASTTANVYLQEVTVTDGTETTTAASYFHGGDYAATDKSTNGEIPTGQDITLVPGTVAGKGFDKWTIVTANGGTLGANKYTAAAGAAETAGTAQTITAHYAASNGAVTVTIKLNDAADTGNRHTVKLSTASGSLTGAVPLTEGSSDSIYTNTNVPAGTYYVFVDDVCVDTTGFTLAAGATKDDIEVDYYTVTLTEGAGVATGTAAMSGATANSVNGGYLKGATLTLSGNADSYYNVAASNWADDMPIITTGATSVTFPAAATTSGSTASRTLGSLTKQTAYTLSFDKLTTTVTYTRGVLPTPAPGGTDTITLPAQATVNQGENYTVVAPSATPAPTTGWAFTGWKEGTTDYAVGATLAVGGTAHTLDAQWNVKVSFDLNAPSDLKPTSGIDAPGAEWVAYNTKWTKDDVAGKSISGSPTSHVFQGWSLTNTAGSTVINSDTTFTGPTTLYGVWTAKGGDAQVTINVDGTPTNAGVTSVKVNNKDLTWDGTNKVWKTDDGGIPAGKYNVFVNGVDTGVEITVPKGDTGTAKVDYYTVSVTTDGNGSAKVETASTKRLGDASATSSGSTAGKIVVQSGVSVTWSYVKANDYFMADAWASTKGEGGTPSSANITAAIDADADKTQEATFKRKTSNVVIALKRTPVSGSAADYNTTGTVTLGTSSYTAILSTAGHSLTINNVPQNGTTYKLMWGSADSGSTVTVGNADNGSTVNGTINFYEVQAISDGYGTAKVTFGTDTQTTTNATPASITVLNGSSVTWGHEDTTANYVFDHWDTNTKTEFENVTVNAAVAHTAHFARNKFNATLKVTLNGQPQSDAEGTVVTAVTNNTTTPTIAYNSTAGGWVSSAITSNGTDSITWTVTDPNGVTHTVTDSDLAKNDTDSITLNLYSVTIMNGEGGNAAPSNNATFAIGSGESATKPTTVYLSANTTTAAIATNHKAKYTVSGWLGEAHASAPSSMSTTLAAANGSVSSDNDVFTLGSSPATALKDGAGLYIQPTYTYEATVKTVYGTDETVTNPGGTVLLRPDSGSDVTLTGFNGSQAKSGLVPGVTYTVWVNGFKTDKTVTAPGTTSVPLVKITTAVAPDAAASSGTAYVNIGASASGTATSIYVPSGATTGSDGNASISLAASATGYYKLASTVWTGATAKATFGAANAANSALNLTGLTDDLTVTANLTLKTSPVKVVLHVDGAVKNPGRAVSIELNGTTKTIAANATETTFEAVPQSATAYPITAEGASYGTDVTVPSDTDGKTVTFVVDFATAEVVTNGNGNATVTIAKYGDLTADLTDTTADPTTKTASVIGLKGQEAKWHNAAPATNYSFKTWDNKTPADKTDQTVTLAATKVTHTAYFEKTSYDTYLTLTMNGDYVTNSADDWSGWVVKLGTNTVEYDSTNNRWVAKGVPSGSTDNWTVTTPNTGDYTVTNAGDDQTATQAFYGLQTVDTAYDTAQATMAVNSKSGLTQAEVKLNDPVTLAVTAADDYTHVSPYWTEGTASKGTVAKTSYTLTGAVTADQTLTPTFTYTATIRPTRPDGEGVKTYDVETVVVKDAAGNVVGTATEQDDKTWKVSGLTIGTNYDIWVNGYQSDKDTNGINTVEVPIWFVTTTEDPANSTTGRKVGGKEQVDMPSGASTSTNLALNVNAATGYRLRTFNESPTPTWTKTADAATLTLAAAGNSVAIANIQADVALTANAIRQWTVNVVNASTDGGTLNAPTITSGTGTVGTLTSGNYPNNIVDNGGTINVSAVAKADFTAVWSAAKPDGTALADKVDAATGGAVTVDQDMTITVSWTANKYKYVFDPNTGAFAGSETGYDATSKKVILSGTVGTTLTAPTQPTKTKAGGADRNYAFDGWYTAATGGTKVTEHKIPGGAGFNDGDVTKTVYAHWTPLYNVTYVNGVTGSQHGKVDTTKNLTDHAEYTYTVLSQSDVIGKADGATNGSWDAASKLYFTDDSGHWKFKGWKSSALAADAAPIQGGQQFTLNQDVTLTAVWEKTYLVTLGDAVSAQDGATKLSAANVDQTNATMNGAPMNTAAGGTKSIWVPAGNKVEITAVSLGGAHTGYYIFDRWVPTASTGSFGDKGDAVEVTDFTPTADTTLTPAYWLQPTLSGDQKHHLNKNVDAVITDAPWSGAKNTLPQYVWTKNDAKLDPTQIQIQIGSDWKDLTVAAAAADGVDVVAVTDAAGNVTYTFQRGYLVNLPVPDGVTNATFKVRVYSKTPSEGTQTNREANLTVYVTPDPLEEVNIQVKEDTAKSTVKVNVTSQDGVMYKDHQKDTIEPTNKLTYTWYVSDDSTNKPDQKKYTTTLDNRAASVTNAKTDADALGAKISDEEITNNFVDVTGKNEYKSKWLYAVVAASGTGYGAVITNAIAVDYDAKIAVNQDGSPIAAAKADGYRVFLVPSTADLTKLSINGDGDLTGEGTVPAPHTGTNNIYATADSVLQGGASYNVYVNKVEGNFEAYMDTGIDVATQINSAGPDQTIHFYSVNKANAAAPHDATDSANKSVGEVFAASGDDAKPDTAFTTPRTGVYTAGDPIAVDDGKGVLKTSAITAKTTSKTWGQDYHVDWNHGTTNANLSFNETNKQTRDKAYDEGYAKVTSVTAKTWIGMKLHQNVYEIKGNVWVMGANKQAGILTDDDHVATLTYKAGENTYTFKPTSKGTGVHQGTMTFTVPRSGLPTEEGTITGQYVITAQPKTSPKTTILKYIPGQNVTTATNTSIDAVDALDPKQTLANVPAGGVTDPTFTIVVDASSYTLEVRNVKPADGSGDGTQDTASQRSVDNTLAAAQNYPTSDQQGHVGVTWTENYAYTAGETYKVRVTNLGNTDLTVYLDLKKTVGSDPATSIFSDAGTTLTAGTGTHTDANDVVFKDLLGHFDLDPGQSKEFTVTIPVSLDVDETATYDFLFSSKERGVATNPYGPSVAYRLAQTVKPLEVQEVKAVSTSSDASGKKIWQPADLKISGFVAGTNMPSDVRLPSATETDPDVVYDWYAVAHGTAVDKAATDASGKLTLADGSTPAAIPAGTLGVAANGLTYTEHDAHKGMDIYLVARGSGTGNVIKAYLTDPPQIIVNYDLDIKVLENDDLTKTEDNYVVYLWPDKIRQADGTTMATNTDTFSATSDKTITAEMGTNEADGIYTAKGLDPDVTYTIYTNAVGGATGANLQDSKVTASYKNFQDKTSPEVIYRDVTVNNTTTDNGVYSAAITDNTTAFLKTYTTEEADESKSPLNVDKAPAASVGTDKTPVATDADNKWVQKGTTVNLEYEAWTKDYTLSWTGATTASATNDANPANGAAATKQVTAAGTVIKTKLTLNLYTLTAHVVGDNGAVDEINLKGTSEGALNITTVASGSGKWMGTASALSSIPAKGSAVFSVPAGSYEVTAKKSAGTTIDGYRDEHNITTNPTSTDKLALTVNANHEMDILIHAAGQSLEAADNAKDQGLATANVTTSAGYSDEGTASNSSTQEITLPYGYDAKSFTLTVKNTSASNLDVLYDVTMEKTSMPTAQITVTDPDKAVSIPLDGTADMNQNDSTVVTINIAKGLDKGLYESTLKFTFKNDETSPVDPLPTATYVLKVKVKPAEFKTVTMAQADGTAIGDMIPYGVNLKASSFTTSDPNLGDLTAGQTNYLTPGTDYRYEWYATDADATLSDEWKDGALTTTVTKIGTGDTLAATEIAKYPGKLIWLAIVAEDGKNVINAAVTSKATGYQPVVKIAVDTATLTKDTKPDAGDYTVTLNDGTSDIPTAWSDDLGGFIPVDGAGAPIALKADTKLSVKVSKAKGLSEQAALSGVELTVSAPSTTVNYYTVNAVATRDFEAISGLGETFVGDGITPLPSISFNLVNGAKTALDDGTPVLSGQKVTAKATGWSQDYKLTWHTATDATGTAAAPAPADNAYVTTATGAKTMTAKGDAQATAAAQAVGASGEVSVGAKTYIGGRLDQNFYKIKGTVKGTGTLTFAGLDLKGAEDATLKQWAFPNADGKEQATANTSNTGSTLVANDATSRNETVTFKVVAGQFDVSVTPASGTVVKSMKWVKTNEETLDGAPLEGKAVAADGLGDTYEFEVQLLATELKLGVNETASGKQAVSTTTQPKGATNSLTRYFSYIHKASNNSQTGATSVFPLVLENPGNKDLSVGMEVFYFNATAKAALNDTYFGTAGNWEGASRANTPIFTAVDGTATTDLAATGGSTETVLALTDLMGTSVTVPKGAAYNATAADNSSVAVGTVTLGEDAWAKDRGAFVFRFKGTTDDAAEGSVVVYYVLDLTVEQLPIKEVSTQMKDKDGAAVTGMPGVGDVLQAKGYDATNDKSLDNVKVQRSSANTDTTIQAATEAKLTDNDIHFAWVSVPGGTTGDILSHFQINASGALEAKDATKDKVLSANANAKTYTMTANELDKDLYLIAYAPNTTAAPQKTNATGMAISDVIQAKRTVGVKISLDGPTNLQNGGPDGKGPGYVVFLVESGKSLDVTKNEDGTYTTGAGTWATTWNNSNAVKAYQAAIDLGTTYEIYAPSYKDGENFVKVGLTLGKQAAPAAGVDELQVVPYFSVAHTANVAVDNTHDKFVSYLPGGVASTDNAIQKGLTVAVSDDKGVTTYTRGDTLTGANVPVLSGMNVQVTVDAAKQSANTTALVKSWSEAQNLHTLTTKGWKKGTTDSNPTTTTEDGLTYPAGVGDPAKYLIQSGNISVDSAKNFTATLKQKLFDVTFTVVDNTPAETKAETGYVAASIAKVKLVPDKAKEPSASQEFEVSRYGDATTPAGFIGEGNESDSSGNKIKGSAGATVTIKGVPMGGFEVLVSETGNRTKVDGFTWNAVGDALNDPKDPGKIVDTNITDAVNKHAGNTIQIQYSSYAVQWQDNFITDPANGTVGGAHATDFYNSTGFAKVDATTPAGPFLALKEGYSDPAVNAVLTYKVRLENNGAMDLAGFWINQTNQTNFTADLTQVTITRKSDGSSEVLDVSKPGAVTLFVGDVVEFEVVIPSGDDEKAPSSVNYDSAFQVKSTSSDNISKSTYTPKYQVKPIVAFDEGSALVIYGNNDFETGTTQVKPATSWDTTAYKPDFQFSILTEEETKAYLKATTLDDNVYYNSEGDNKVPGWVSIAQATGALSFDATTPHTNATEVNVRTKSTTKEWKDYTANEVDNEMVFYLKAEDQQTGDVYYTKYTVNVEPGNLYIGSKDQTQGTDWTFDPKNPDDATKRPYGGKPVNKGDFTYTGVVDQANNVIVAELTAPAINTANGNKTGEGNEQSGEVYDGATHLVTWTLSQTKYVYKEDNSETEYPFTVTYKPSNTAEKWNYKPNTVKPKLNAEKPPEYTVTYDWNGHTPDGKTLPGPYIVDPNDPANKDHTVSTVLTKGTAYKDTGDNLYYTFTGWVEKDTTPAVSRDPGKTFTPTGDVTLVAQWTAKTVTVKYVAVHGTDPASETVQRGTKDHPLKVYYTINNDTGWQVVDGQRILTITESGKQHVYRFEGWTRNNAVVDKIDIDQDGVITVTAKWTEIFTITYANATGAPSTFDPAPKTVKADGGSTHQVLGTGGNAPELPAATGYTFVGWSTTDDFDAGVAAYTPSGTKSFPVKSDVTLYPVWAINRYKLTYDKNGHGSNPPAATTHNYNTVVDISGKTMADSTEAPDATGAIHWLFKGWMDKATEGNDVTRVTMDNNKTVYAKWVKDAHKVAYHGNGGMLDLAAHATATGLDCGSAYTLTDVLPTRANHTFLGWNTAQNGTGTLYQPGATIEHVTTDTTLYAQWSRDVSTVTFVLDGGDIDGETDNIVRTGPTNTTMAEKDFPDTPVRKGYAFEYWLGEDAKIYSVDALPSYPEAKGGNLTITAQWRELVQGLRFSDERGNDADVNDASGKITLVDPDLTLTAPDLQKAFPPARKVERSGEYIVYLDTEPRYTVALHSDGDPVYNMSVTATDVRGVSYTDLPVDVASFASTDGVKTITLDLSALEGTLKAGEHHILLTATGNTEPDGTGAVVTATYELTFVINKRPITQANVTTDPTDPTKPKVDGKLDGDPSGDPVRDLNKEPKPGTQPPVDKVTVTVTPGPDGQETTTVVIQPDPNYIFVPENTDEPNYTMDKDPEGTHGLTVDVGPGPKPEENKLTYVRKAQLTIGAHLVAAAGDVTVTDAFTSLIGKELRDFRAQSDDTVKYPRTGTTYGTDWWWSMGDTPAAVLSIQPGTDEDGKEVKAPVFEFNKTYVLTVKLDPDEANYWFPAFEKMTASFDKDNESLKRAPLTHQANAAELRTNLEGFTILTDEAGNYYLRTWYRANKSTGGGGGGGTPACPSQVSYLLGLYGTTKDPVMELVTGKNVKTVPNVSAIVGYKFLGWSLAGPIGDADKDAARTLVDPKEVPIEGDTTFYAVYQPLYDHGRPFHKHYVIGYPNGNFGPSDNINRASVATIIARAVLPNFVEGADYGNPGGYVDVNGHWAASAIAYCTRYGVFKGYEDGTFRPDQPISRQELVLTLARLSGEQTGSAPFSDINEAGDWAKGGIYTAYVKGWVNGYTDGTFRPTNPIARDETVKIFNAYLYRGVNAEGLASLTEYVHSGVASNNTENGTNEYMTWPDVPKDQWAYYEIIEAANDHEYKPDTTKKAGYTVPEVWTKCWIDEKWRYNDDPKDGGPASVTLALLRKHGVIA